MGVIFVAVTIAAYRINLFSRENRHELKIRFAENPKNTVIVDRLAIQASVAER